MKDEAREAGEAEGKPVLTAQGTLRGLAELAPPVGLEGRVHRRIADAGARKGLAGWGFWTLLSPARRLQYAGAALLIMAVVGSSWSVYHRQPAGQSGAQSGAQPGAPLTASQSALLGSGFATAGAERRPATISPIKIRSGAQPVAKKKPSASHLAKKKPVATADDSQGKPAAAAQNQ